MPLRQRQEVQEVLRRLNLQPSTKITRECVLVFGCDERQHGCRCKQQGNRVKGRDMAKSAMYKGVLLTDLDKEVHQAHSRFIEKNVALGEDVVERV